MLELVPSDLTDLGALLKAAQQLGPVDQPAPVPVWCFRSILQPPLVIDHSNWHRLPQEEVFVVSAFLRHDDVQFAEFACRSLIR